MTQETTGILLAFAGALFAGAVAVLAKLGYTGVDSTLATALRTVVVLVFAWGIAALGGPLPGLAEVPLRSWIFLTLSGLATGASWLCQNAALQRINASLAAPIDKLSIVVTIVFSHVILKEKLPRAARIGLVLLVAGTLGLLV